MSPTEQNKTTVTGPRASVTPLKNAGTTGGKESETSLANQEEITVDRAASMLAGKIGKNPDGVAKIKIEILALWKAAGVNDDLEDLVWVSLEDSRKLVTKKGERDNFPQLSTTVQWTKYSVLMTYATEIGLNNMAAMVDVSLKQIRELTTKAKKQADVPPLPTTETTQAATSQLKYTMPKLKKWDGNPAAYFSWKDQTYDSFGTVGLTEFLQSEGKCAQDPKCAQSIFFALKAAITSGAGKTLMEELSKSENYNCAVAWNKLKSQFATEQNQMMFLCKEIGHLIELRLDDATTPTEFETSFVQSLTKLNEYGATIANDSTTLRALLLRAIQSEEYSTVADWIMSNPKASHTEILNQLSQKETVLAMKHGGDGIVIDETRSRRVQFNQGTKSADGSSTKDGDNFHDRFPKWNIPHFPKSWAKVFNEKLYQHVKDWRNTLHGTKQSPKKVNAQFELDVDFYTPKKRKQGERRRTRRAPLEEAQTGGLAESDDEESPPTNQQQRKRINYFSIRNAL